MRFIYCIFCLDCAYIGQTYDIKQRIIRHGDPPFWAILETVHDERDVTRRELFWIRHFQSLGVTLLNRIDPRDYGHPSPRPLSRLKELKRMLTEHGDSDECLLWPFSTAGEGYGQVATGNGQKKYVHRLSYELAHPGEEIPSAMDVMHSARCINRRCFNQRHLTVGTRQQNVDTAKELGRLHGPGVGTLAGHRNGRAILTEAQVAEIRQKYIPLESGKRGRGMRTIAREYGVARTTIQKIIQGENWPHLLQAKR
jgi:hypothetical protein